VEALSMVAVACGRVHECLEHSLKSEEGFTDKGNYEFPSKDPLAVSTRQECAKVFEREVRTDLCQPDNMELLLKCHARFEVNQVAAFRDYLKVNKPHLSCIISHFSFSRFCNLICVYILSWKLLK
jgi:hypothetical protein